MTAKALVTPLLSPTVSVPSTAGWIRSIRDPEAEVRPRMIEVALRTAGEVAYHLDIDPGDVRVNFFSPCAPDHPDAVGMERGPHGFTRESETRDIHLSTALTPRRLVEAASHEVRHLWQFRQGWPLWHSRPLLELDATTFAREWMARYGR